MRWISFIAVIFLIGCSNKEDRTLSGVISMKDVPQGWGSKSVPVGHPQMLIDPAGNLLIRNADVEVFFNYHGSMKWKVDLKWELQPCDLHGGRFHRLVNIEENEDDT